MTNFMKFHFSLNDFYRITLLFGVLIFTQGCSKSFEGEAFGKNGKFEGDLFTERNNWELVEGEWKHSLVPASWGMTHYVRLLIEGKTWTQICTFMNENQWWDEGKPPRTNQNYKHHPN